MKLWFALSIKYLDLIFTLAVVFSQSLPSPRQPWSGVTWKHEDLTKSSFFFLETLSFWQPLNCVPAEPGDLWVHSQ